MTKSEPRGSWRPARMSGGDLLLITWTMIGMSLIRGGDYAIGDDGSGRSLIVVEMAAPLGIWAFVFIASGLTLTAGVVFRVHVLVYVGHWLLGVAYASVCAGIVLAVFAESPYLDGIRSAAVLALPTILHFMLAARTGRAPVTPRESHPVETIRKGN